MRRVITSSIALFLVAACCTLLGGLLLLVRTAPAADLTWNPGGAGGGTGTWDTTTTSWDNAGTPQAWNNAAADTAIFAGTAGTVTLTEAITAAGLQLDTAGYTVAKSGNDLTTASLTGSGAVTFSGTGTLFITGSSGSYSRDVTLGPGSNQATTDVVVLGASDSLGTGTINMRGAQLQAGTTGLSIANNVSVAAGGLRLGGTNDFALSGTVTLDNSSRSLVNYGSAAISINAVNLTAGAGSTAAFDGGALTVTGDISGAGRVVVTNNVSTAAATLAGDTTFTGGGTVANGSLALTGSNSGTGAWTINSGGTLDLTGGTGLYKGLGFFGTANQAYVTVNSGGRLISDAFNYGVNNNFNELRNNYGQIVLNGGTLQLESQTFIRGFSIGSSGGTVEIPAGQTVTKTAGTTASQNIIRFSADSTLTLAVDGTFNLGDALGSYGSTGFSLSKTGSGTVNLTSRSTYTGATTVSAGTLVLATPNFGRALATSGITVASGATLDVDGTNILYSGSSYIPITLDGGLLQLVTGSGGHNHFGPLTLNGGTISGKVQSPFGNEYSTFDSDVTVGGSARSTIQGDSGSFGYSLASNTRTFTVADTGDASGVDLLISSPLLSGGLVKAGAGTMLLSGSNTFTGGVTVTAGSVIAANGNALGTGGTVTLGSAGSGTSDVAVLIDATAGGVTVARPITVAGGGTGTYTIGSATASGTAIAGFTGAVTLARDVVLDGGAAGGRLDFAGGISGTGNVSVDGTTRVIFRGAENTYAGSTTVSGVLQLSDGTATATSLLPDAQPVTVASGGELRLAKGSNSETIGALDGEGTVSNIVAGITSTLVVGGGDGSGSFAGSLANPSGTLALEKTGTGTQILAGTNTYTGTTTVSGGTLAVTGSLAAGSTVSVASGGTLAGSGTAAGLVTVASGGTLSPGTLSAGTLTLGSLTFGSTVGDTATVAIPVSAGGSLTALVSVGGDVTANGGTDSVTLALGSNLALLDSGTYSLIGYSGSQLADIDAYTYTGTVGGRQGVSLANGTGSIDLVVSNAFPIWVGDQGSGWSTANNWKLNTTDTATSFLPDDTVVFNDSGLTGTVDLTQDVAPATTTFNGDTLAYTLGSTGNFAITSGSLVKSGAATVTISSANSFAGGTQLTAGTLILGDAAALGSGAVSLEGGTLDLGGSSIANAVTLAGGTIAGSGGTIAGIVSEAGGARSLAVASDLTLTGSNTFTGGTSISAGTLTIGGSGTLGGGSYSGAIVNDGTLAIATSADQTLSGAVSGSGRLAKSAAGTLSLTGGLTYTGETAIDAGTLSITTSAPQTLAGAITGSGSLVKAGVATLTLAAANTYSGPIDISAGTIAFTAAADQSLAGVVSGSGSILQNGSGTLTLTGVNTYSGSTTISAGTLEIGGAGQLGGGSYGAITNNGQLAFSTSADQTITGAISGTGSLVKSGSGTLTMNATQTYSGPTTVSGGTLVVTTANTANGSLANSPTITISDTGTLRIAAQDGLGYTNGREALVINSGGTVTIDSGLRATIRNTITMSGGTLAGVGNGDANGNYSLLDFGVTATSDASGNPALISAPRVSLQNSGGTTTFNVTRGVAEPASDLTVSGSIIVNGGNTNGINKTGNGIMTLAGPANSYRGTTLLSGGTLAVTGTISATPLVSIVAATLDVGTGADITTGRFVTTNNSGSPASFVNHTGGTITVTGTDNTSTTAASILLGHWPGSTTYTMSGGTFTAAGAMITMGWDASTVDFNQSGGEVNVLGIQLANGKNNPAAYNLTGGTLTLGASGITANAAKSINLGAGTVAASADWSSSQAMTLTDSVTGVTFDTSTHAVSLSGALSGTGRLVMAGGDLSLSAANSYSGGTTVSGGTLRASNDAALGAGNVAVNAGGRLIVDAALDLGVGNSVSLASGGILELADNASVPFAAGANIAGFTIVPSASGNEGDVLAGTTRGGQATAGWLTRPVDPGFASDILDISTGDGLGSVEPFVLSLTYDASIDPADEANAFLFWNSTPGGTATWVNAVDGNLANNASLAQQGYLGSFADFQITYGTTLTDYMGAYGRDAASDSVWAVVNHNSEFVVSTVPEPGSIAILAGAAAAALAFRRRRLAATF